MDPEYWQTVGQWEEFWRASAIDWREQEIDMAIIASDIGGTFKPVPQGAHMARCYRVIDIGTQEVEWEGEKKLQRKVVIGWELFGEDEDGKPLEDEGGMPLTISKRYTVSLGKNAKLRADLESWRGKAFTDQELKGFDIGNLLGVYCMVNVTHNSRDGKTYSNIASISPVPSALRNSKPAGIHPLELFDLTDPNMEIFGRFHDKLKEVIKASYEWQSKHNVRAEQDREAKEAATTADDDIDF